MVSPFQKALKFYADDVNNVGAQRLCNKQCVFKQGSGSAFCAEPHCGAFFKRGYSKHSSLAFEPTASEARIENERIRELETSLLTTT
jgi:hypothetical protein